MKTSFKIILCLLLLLPLQLFAQSQQQVMVREYREKSQKTPLEGVSLSVQNAGSSISDAQGSMTLQFRTLKAGDAVQVRRVDLAGYEIFNREAVEQWTISPQQAFNLVLCRSDRFKQLRDQYMRVSSASYERQYKQDQARLAALRKENKLQEEAYQQQLSELENNYYEQLDNLENYVDRFARIDLSELNAQEQHLIELVQEGKIDEAIQLYESADYLSQYTTQVNDLKEINRAQAVLAQVEAEKLSARDKVQAAINRQVQTYQLAGGRENFNKIAALLKGVADADTTNLDAVWAYGEHCLNQNKFDECEKYMHVFLRQCEDNPLLQSQSYLTLGKMFGSKFVFDQAEKYDLLAVSTAERSFAADSVKSLRHLLNAYCELHSFYEFTNQFESALSFTEKLRNRLESCYNEDPENWTISLVYLYAQQGRVYYYINNDFGKAEQLLKKSYALAKQLVEDNNSIKTTDLLMNTILRLNQLYYSEKQWQKMESYMLEELNLRQQSYENNLDNEVRYLLAVYNNLTELYYNLDRLEDSHQYLDKALNCLTEVIKLYEESSIIYDKVNLYDVASQLYYKEGNFEQARTYATQCLESYNNLPDELKEGLEELVQRNQDYLK